MNQVNPEQSRLHAGDQLRVAREAMGLAQADVAARLKMPLRVVRSLEEEDWSRLGAPVFVRGQLRSYARLLGLDADPVVEAAEVAPVAPPVLTPRTFTPPLQRLAEQAARRFVYVVMTVAIAIPVWLATRPQADLVAHDAAPVAVARLDHRVAGRVVDPGDAEYHEMRAIFYDAGDSRPAAIVRVVRSEPTAEDWAGAEVYTNLIEMKMVGESEELGTITVTLNPQCLSTGQIRTPFDPYAGEGPSAKACRMAVGAIFGIIAGFSRGWVDSLIGRAIDLTLSFPQTLMLLALAAVGLQFVKDVTPLEGPAAEAGYVIGVLALFGWPQTARVIRGQVLSIREREFVDAAVVLGASRFRIYFREILPNLWAPLLVLFTLLLPAYVSAEAALSYLGVSVKPPTPTLGNVLRDSLQYATADPVYFFVPAILIAVIVISFNLLGDGLRDALDPKGDR